MAESEGSAPDLSLYATPSGAPERRRGRFAHAPADPEPPGSWAQLVVERPSVARSRGRQMPPQSRRRTSTASTSIGVLESRPRRTADRCLGPIDRSDHLIGYVEQRRLVLDRLAITRELYRSELIDHLTRGGADLEADDVVPFRLSFAREPEMDDEKQILVILLLIADIH